jgi:hypothetical protein
MSHHVWHTCYEILGDDIVIFDRGVYLEYLQVMSLLGVEINLSKSLVSEKTHKVLEFAKRTSVNGKEVSGLSWKEVLTGMTGWQGVIPLTLSLGSKGLLTSMGSLIRLMARRRKGLIPTKTQDSKVYRIFVNISLSLLNHFALIGLVSLRSAFSYVVDPRMGVDESSIIGSPPVTTMVHDIFVLINSLPLFRETGMFDKSKLILSDPLYRDYLVGAKLLPFWGHGLDMRMISRINKFLSELPHFPSKILILMMGSHKFPDDISSWSSFEIDFYNYVTDVTHSLLFKGRSDSERLDDLRAQFERTLHKRSFEETLRVHSELELLLTKYDGLTKVLDKTSTIVVPKVPNPMGDVRLASTHQKAFEFIKADEKKPMLFTSPWQAALRTAPKDLRVIDVLKARNQSLLKESGLKGMDWMYDDPDLFSSLHRK